MKSRAIKINIYQSGFQREITFYGVQVGKKIFCGQKEFYKSVDGGLYNKYPKHHSRALIGEVISLIELT